MDWSRTKIVFIVIFLVLDIYLFMQYHQKQRSLELEYLSNTPVEESLAISKGNLEKLPKDTEELSYLSATAKFFRMAELDKKVLTTNQTVKIVENNILSSIIENPRLKFRQNDLTSLRLFINQYVMNAEQYEFWSYDRVRKKIILLQTYKGHPIYNNQFARLEILLDDDLRMIGYLQTMLQDVTFIGGEKEQPVVLSAIEALKIIKEKGVSLETSKILDVRIGYYTYVPLQTGTQVFTPTWYFQFDDGKSFFVNAIEGQIINDSQLQLE